jgi:transposase
MRLPQVTDREWRLIAPLLPPAHGPGKPRRDDRRYLSAFFYAAACNCSLESLPAAYGNARSLRTRRQRWQADGTLARLMEAGAPVIARLRAGYWGLIRDASLDWRNSSEFFGQGAIPKLPRLQPRGRYAGRQRRPARANEVR